MKITINARVLNERPGGPARATLNLIKELAKLDKKNTYQLLFYNDYNFDFELPENFSSKIIKFKNKIFFDYIYLPLYSYFKKIDIFLFPKNTFSPFIRGKKILIFHDIIYFEKLPFREFKFFDNLHHTIMIPISAKFSTMNIAVSDTTADKMTELLKIKKEKIRVIKNGVEKSFRIIKEKKILDNLIKKYNLKNPFFFYSGSLSPRKNMINVMKAFKNIKNRVPHNLYFTASDSWRDKEIFAFIAKEELNERIIKLGFLDDEELVVMYNLADCYLYPSLYEGFGLPILEAQSCGCPVITSDTTSCPEVAGDSAIIVDPYKIDEIQNAMLQISNDKKLKEKLIKKGTDNIKKYSWEKTAKEFIELFNDI